MDNTSSSLHSSIAKSELGDGNNLQAKLVELRKLAGFKTTRWNYSQNSVICTVEHKIENQCAGPWFLPSSPIALLHMGDKFSNIVWTMNPKELSTYREMNENDFVKALNHALNYGYGLHPQSNLLGNNGDIFSWFRRDLTFSANECFEVPPNVVKLVSGRMVFPLSLRLANNYASKRVILISDAAHTVHPLVGQGVNLGFGDAFALSRIISEGTAVGTDIGEVCILNFL
ncbi:ubiquinone biosynthesis monooxygenase COQ6, mitochondrial [Vitis riparia]|uniref:ubiquinone biosynthesis monooxygenase COQ6, mitochondrial n=1 Tax=Vitis riparia TaxID=96939 RepID=UPI00155A1ED9|nr:ubiquinone biosynthesis monooxygenase COQ6, mitochondrial [Vitis riparia]